MHGARADLDFLKRSVPEQLARLDARKQRGVVFKDAVDSQYVWHEVVGEDRQSPLIAGREHSGSCEVRGGDLGALKKGTVMSPYVETSRKPRQPESISTSRSAESPA